MFFKSKKEEIEVNYVEKPLQYWEEDSYFLVPYKGEILTKEEIINNLSKIEGFKLIGFAESFEDKPGRIVFNYKKKEYEIFYKLNDFSYPEPFFYQMKNMTEEENINIKNFNRKIILFMEIKEDIKNKYQVEIIVATKIVNEFYGILDESAEKAIPPKLAIMIANSNTVPGSDDMYSIQAIVDDANDKVWLHTHGLLRYGIPELEILESNLKNYNSHYNIISSLADTLINKGLNEDNIYHVGYVNESIPLFVTLIPWTKGLKYYKDIDLGSIVDREFEHNSKNSILFTFASEDDLKNNIFSFINIYDDMWDDEPIFLFTSEETKRMKELAQEKYYLVKKYFDDKKNNILIKIGIKTDDDSTEHMWFELINILDDTTFEAKLVSSPYHVSNLKEGDIGIYNVDEITDWLIYIDDVGYSPDRSYLIDGE